jgi:hypothetical protein
MRPPGLPGNLAHLGPPGPSPARGAAAWQRRRRLTGREECLAPDRAHALLEAHAPLPAVHDLGRQRRGARRHKHLQGFRLAACGGREGGGRRLMGPSACACVYAQGAAGWRACVHACMRACVGPRGARGLRQRRAASKALAGQGPGARARPLARPQRAGGAPKFHCHTLPMSAAPETRKVLRYHSISCCCSSVGALGSVGSGAGCCACAAATCACERTATERLRWMADGDGMPWDCAWTGARRARAASSPWAAPFAAAHLLLLLQLAQPFPPGLLLLRFGHLRPQHALKGARRRWQR